MVRNERLYSTFYGIFKAFVAQCYLINFYNREKYPNCFAKGSSLCKLQALREQL